MNFKIDAVVFGVNSTSKGLYLYMEPVASVVVSRSVTLEFVYI